MRNLVQNTVAITIAVMIFAVILIPELDRAGSFMDDTTALVADVLPVVLLVAILIACVHMLSGRSRYRTG